MRSSRVGPYHFLAGGLLFVFACTAENAGEPSAPPPEGGAADAILPDSIPDSIPADGMIDADRMPDASLDATNDVSSMDARDVSSETDASFRDTRDASVIDM